jgi:hypothetical protein
MPEEPMRPKGGPFIGPELRPEVGSVPPDQPPLELGLPKEELLRRARDTLNESLRVQAAPADDDVWQTIFVPHSDVLWADLEGETVLLDLDGGRDYNLNRVGSAVWALLDGERSLDRICSAICERFDAVEGEVRRDLVALIARLRQKHLVVERG